MNAAEKVQQLATANTAKLLSVGGGGSNKKRKVATKSLEAPPAPLSVGIDNVESAWEEVEMEVKPEVRAPLATLVAPEDTSDIPSTRMSSKEAKKWLVSKRPNLVEACKKMCPQVHTAQGPGRRHHTPHCPYQRGLDKLQGK